MGDAAQMLLDGEVDFFSGEYLDGESPGYPRTYRRGKIGPIHVQLSPSEKKIRAVRIELAKLIKARKKLCTTEKEKNNAVNLARQEINAKYGKGWRERGMCVNDTNQWTPEELAPYTRKGRRNGSK